MTHRATAVPVLNTRRLFLKLLKTLRVNAVCDVGSMNGTDALAFRRELPRARIVAFEPNPQNLKAMSADPRLEQSGIEVVPLAVTNYVGDADFFLVEADYSTVNDQRGRSSLLQRSDGSSVPAPISVATTRLDDFLADWRAPDLRLALWIDVEGKAYEAIEGSAAILTNTVLLHVEVETSPCVAEGQRLYPAVRSLLTGHGFVELATDAPPERAQCNALFVRRALSFATRARVSLRRTEGHLRSAARRVIVGHGFRP
jgi:FkbM family methyltransferase